MAGIDDTMAEYERDDYISRRIQDELDRELARQEQQIKYEAWVRRGRRPHDRSRPHLRPTAEESARRNA